jgi:hypothetical protein
MSILLVLLSAVPADALTSRQGGPSLDVAAGLGLRGSPALLPSAGGMVSAGWWTGTYDDQYAFGRYWWVGPTVRVDWHPDALGLAPMLELRRGLELFVAGVAPFLAVGPALAFAEDPTVGLTARTGLNVKLRRTRYLGLTLRLEGGVDVADRVGFGGGALLGVAFARPSHPITGPAR